MCLSVYITCIENFEMTKFGSYRYEAFINIEDYFPRPKRSFAMTSGE
jgi:hypothetical protein